MKALISVLFFITISLSVVSGNSFDNDNDPQKAIVLINGVAYLVDVTPKGSIIATYQKIDNYFNTSESHNSLLTRLSKGSISEDSKSIVFYEKEAEPVKSFASENNAPILTGNSHYIGFSPSRAILKKTAVDQIRKIAKSYEHGNLTNILIQSYHQDSYKSRSLARNRANAISDLLKAFGVPQHVVTKETPYGGPNTKADYVGINF